LLRLTGDRRLLQTWISKILGPTGWAREDNADGRESSAEEYLPFARQIGEDSLADQAEKRVRWFRISCRGHKNYSFGWPAPWFEELAKIDSTAMPTHGFRLLTLCEAHSAQGDIAHNGATQGDGFHDPTEITFDERDASTFDCYVAIPTSAGASLILSPAIATTQPCRIQYENACMPVPGFS
jgi:hypothetical protein